MVQMASLMLKLPHLQVNNDKELDREPAIAVVAVGRRWFLKQVIDFPYSLSQEVTAPCGKDRRSQRKPPSEEWRAP
jgi:hypothetical protein